MLWAIGFLSLWTGSSKAISVCGINGALALRPAHRPARATVLGYFVPLYLGAMVLVAVAMLVGGALALLVPMTVDQRAWAGASLLFVTGAYEAATGRMPLPHIAWAFPRTWVTSRFGLPLFGLIRGVAVLNHSPFASMHCWLVLLVLFPSENLILPIGVLIATGLAFWSIVDSVAVLLRPSTGGAVLDKLSTAALARRVQITRADGFILMAMGVGLPYFGLGT